MQSGGRGDMGRTAIEVLDEFEEMWVPSMRAVSLAAELQFEVQDVRLAAECLGALYNAHLGQRRVRQEQIRVYPASVVIALSGIGALEYEAGTYWSASYSRAPMPDRAITTEAG